jgi:8-oxo-dGTP pyrophosphatase MutT (NUDIX family)
MAAQLTSAAHILLYNEHNALLMLRRFNTGYEDGNFSVLAGHLEDEPAKAAARREGKEEANIDIDEDDLEFVHLMHRRKPNGEIKLDFFFRCTRWSGTVENAEPHKCDLMTWRADVDLPPNTVPYVRAAVDHVRAGRTFSEYGWFEDTAVLTG